jgi:hypothetical protein
MIATFFKLKFLFEIFSKKQKKQKKTQKKINGMKTVSMAAKAR